MGDWRPGSTGKHDAASPAAAAAGPLLPRANSDGSEANQGKNDYASGVVCPACSSCSACKAANRHETLTSSVAVSDPGSARKLTLIPAAQPFSPTDAADNTPAISPAITHPECPPTGQPVPAVPVRVVFFELHGVCHPAGAVPDFAPG